MHEIHYPVLLKEVVDVFKDLKGGIFVDCTLGYAGHSKAILQANPNLSLVASDQDEEAIKYSTKALEEFKDKIKIYKTKFSNILDFVPNEKISGLLADIGLSSLQIDKNDRGFCLNSDYLDMRMDKENSLDAKYIINNYSKEQLSEIFYNYGELSDANFLADKIIQAREKKEIISAKELYEIIGKQNVKGRKVQKAILLFQALRIEVNKELNELETLLDKIENSTIKDAKIAIITFHSLEDRIVKNRFKKWAKSCLCPPFAIKCECANNNSIGKILSKVILPSKEEIRLNSRSSCAKLRLFHIKR